MPIFSSHKYDESIAIDITGRVNVSLIKYELELCTPLDKEVVYLIGIGYNNEMPTEKLLEYKVNNYTKGYNLDSCPVLGSIVSCFLGIRIP